MHINLDKRVQYILNILNEYGSAYIVGGAIRDILLGIEPQDYDLASNISMSELFYILDEYNPVVISEKYEIVSIEIEGINIEIARFRKENGVLDGRNPEHFSFVDTIEEDLKRRDFTINAFAYSSNTGLIDIYNGLEDLENRKVNVVGEDAFLRLKEDNVRVLRALYLVSKFDFKLSCELKEAIEKFDLQKKYKISKTIFFKTLNKILFNKYSYKALDMAINLNVLNAYIPEINSIKKNKVIQKDLVNAYKVYCKYNAYEEKSIGYAIFCIYLGKSFSTKNYMFSSISFVEAYLKQFNLNIVDIILTKNLIYYSNITDKKLGVAFIKRMLFEFRNNKNVSKLLNLISFINHHSKDYNNIMKKTLELLSKIQSIYFNGDIIFMNDMDISIVDIYNLKLPIDINRDYIRKEIYNKLIEGELINVKKDIIEYINDKYADGLKITEVKSSGALVFRYDKEKKLEFLLVKINGGNWGFPKGHIEENENEIEAAKREIKEETGLDVELYYSDEFKKVISYITNDGNLKYVTLYLAEVGNDDQVYIDNDEIVDYKWLRLDEALKVITYSSQRDVLHSARLYLFMRKGM